MNSVNGVARVVVAAFLATSACFALTSSAQALTFDFSFTNTFFVPPTFPNGIPGTVTGEVSGLVDNTAFQQATSVTIDSYPAGLTGLPAAPFALTLPSTAFNNRFSVTAGVVTFAYFFDQNSELALNGAITYLQSGPLNVESLVAATFTPAAVTSETPLPGALPLFASGLAGFGMIGWRRKRKAIAAAR